MHISCSYLLVISPKVRTVDRRIYIFYMTVFIRKAVPGSCKKKHAEFSDSDTQQIWPTIYIPGNMIGVVVIAFSIVTFIFTSLIIKKVGHLFLCIG